MTRTRGLCRLDAIQSLDLKYRTLGGLRVCVVLAVSDFALFDKISYRAHMVWDSFMSLHAKGE